MDLDHEETERRKTTAEFLASERERYEYLLKCAAAAEHEELAWETINARLTVEDFVTAAAELRKLRTRTEEDSRALDRWCEWQDFVIAAAKQLGVYEELSEKLDKSYEVKAARPAGQREP